MSWSTSSTLGAGHTGKATTAFLLPTSGLAQRELGVLPRSDPMRQASALTLTAMAS